MLGRNPGYVTTQGEVLSDLFDAAGYSVVSVSAQRSRHRRLAEIVATLFARRAEIDVVVIDVYGGLSFVIEDVAGWLSRRLRKRVVMMLHGGAMPDFMRRHPRWTRRVLGRADALIAPSNFLAQAVAPYGFRARVIPNVIDLSAYPYRHRERLSPRLFWMRQFHPIWNPMMALRVLARLRRTSAPDATLIMAGPDKGQEAEVRCAARELGLNDAVSFSGFLDMEAKTRAGESADVFLNTNRIDNMPVAVVEACAMGLPVVAAKVGGIPDLLTDGETGLLVSDDDDEAMAEAVSRLLSDPVLAGRLSANGQRLAACSSWERVRPQWEEVFAEVSARSESRGE
jgi:glycosyltransferase involved in cell wall biosynthesis